MICNSLPLWQWNEDEADCHTVSQNGRRVNRVSDSHLEGNGQQLHSCEHSPASVFVLGWVLMNNTVTCPCMAEEVPRASVSVFYWSMSREQIHFQVHLGTGKVGMILVVIIYVSCVSDLGRYQRQADAVALAISWSWVSNSKIGILQHFLQDIL